MPKQQAPARSARFGGTHRVLALLVLAALSTAALAAEPAAKPAVRAAKPKAAAPSAPSALDDALLKDLDNELLEGIDDAPRRTPAKAAAGGAEAGDEAAGNASQGDDDSIGEDVGRNSPDPLIRIGGDMRTAGRLIERRSAEKAAQLQTEIVSELEELIKKLEQQCQSGQSSASSQSSQAGQASSRSNVKQPGKTSGKPAGEASNKPAKESTERLGKNEVQQPDMDALRGLMKDIWGQLPAHAREQMLQSSPERFLPKYELLIEKYYKRLAEEQKQKP